MRNYLLSLLAHIELPLKYYSKGCVDKLMLYYCELLDKISGQNKQYGYIIKQAINRQYSV